MSNLENDDRFTEERINGVIYLMARPAREHLRIQGNILTIFNNYFISKDKKCEAVFEDEIRINKDNKIVPDVLVYCYDDNNNKSDNEFDLPLIVIEVLSKSTRKKDLTVKKKKYAELGVQEYWVVDYKSSVMDIYILENGQYDFKFSCGIDDENIDEDDEKEENKDLVPEFSPALFPDMTVKAKDIFYSVR